MKEDSKAEMPDRFQESDIKGEKIIFDILIKEKLAHVIVIKDDQRYHVNVNAEDLGYFIKQGDEIQRFTQPRGAADDVEDYFQAVEEKLQALNK
jgi:hypothetical protein